MPADYQREYKCQIVVDAVAEYLAMKWTPTMIFNKLRENFKELTRKTNRALIRAAKQDIADRYGIDAEEYKGHQIAFYEMVMRGRSFNKDGIAAKTKEKLTAAKCLDELLNLASVQGVDPHDKAQQIMDFIAAAEATIGSGVNPYKQKPNSSEQIEESKDGKHNQHAGRSEDDQSRTAQGNGRGKAAGVEGYGTGGTERERSDTGRRGQDDTPRSSAGDGSGSSSRCSSKDQNAKSGTESDKRRQTIANSRQPGNEREDIEGDLSAKIQREDTSLDDAILNEFSKELDDEKSEGTA